MHEQRLQTAGNTRIATTVQAAAGASSGLPPAVTNFTASYARTTLVMGSTPVPFHSARTAAVSRATQKASNSLPSSSGVDTRSVEYLNKQERVCL